MACCQYSQFKFDGTDGVEKLCSHDLTDEHIKENIRIINIHRVFVYGFGKTIYPEYNFIAHDLSKFSSTELVPYTLKFILKVEDSKNPGWEAALQHHYDNNPHHPQYWGEKAMPEEFLKESIVDMIAARYQYSCEEEKLPDYLNDSMFEMNPIYLTRYNDSDRQRVIEELERLKAIDWSRLPVVTKPFDKC